MRKVLVEFLAPQGTKLPPRTAKALFAPLIWAWGSAVDDPDARLLAAWLREGAPLGFSEQIPNTGVFPPAETKVWEEESASSLSRALEGWQNHPSAVEWEEDFERLVTEAKEKGFCSIYDNMEDAERDIGRRPTLNKLRLIVKERNGVRKARIIWDLRESGVNRLCSQGERVLLPKITDVLHDTLGVFRKGGTPRERSSAHSRSHPMEGQAVSVSLRCPRVWSRIITHLVGQVCGAVGQVSLCHQPKHRTSNIG